MRLWLETFQSMLPSRVYVNFEIMLTFRVYVTFEGVCSTDGHQEEEKGVSLMISTKGFQYFIHIWRQENVLGLFQFVTFVFIACLIVVAR